VGRPIYVEHEIHAPMAAIWDATQRPEVHRRWDLRFTEIRYLPRDHKEPQRFLYATRIGFGLRIAGEGESVGERERNGERTSALRFWSDDAKSLIREGSGYWRYTPIDGGVRFVTLYDYRTRFGPTGRLLDLIFRPVLGWATAWSFDRLRLWLERGVDPGQSLERSVTHWIGRLVLAFIWLYHGIVPKLIASAGEIEIAIRTGVPVSVAPAFVAIAAVFEIGLGLALLVAHDARPWLLLTGALAIGLALVTATRDPAILVAPFQPVTLGIAMAGLAVLAIRADVDLPRAARCKRKAPSR
jgi:hypothetical protein